jgi:uncharacterized protein
MTIIDANLLIYAYNEASPHHHVARKWLDALLSSGDLIGLTWMTLWAFIRLATAPKVMPRPFEPAEAFSVLREWVEAPGVIMLHPGVRHAELLEQLVVQTGARAGLVTDAALAAIAIESGATLASADHDFRRFPGLRWVNPLT